MDFLYQKFFFFFLTLKKKHQKCQDTHCHLFYPLQAFLWELFSEVYHS